MRKLRKDTVTVLLVLLAVLIGGGIVYAAQFYRLNNGNSQLIGTTEFGSGNCGNIGNSSGKDLFVPTKTLGEWNAFKSHLPGGVSNGPCATYSWYQSGWGSCSVACGGGTQTQTVYCRDNLGNQVADALCGGGKPATSQSCNTQACGSCTIMMLAGGLGGGGPASGPYTMNYGYAVNIDNTAGASACGITVAPNHAPTTAWAGPVYSVPAGQTFGEGPSGSQAGQYAPYTVSMTASNIVCPSGTSLSAPGGMTASCDMTQANPTSINGCSDTKLFYCQ